MLYMGSRLASVVLVILIQIEGLAARDQAALIRQVWESCGEAIQEAGAVSVHFTLMRVRKLPLN